MKFSERGGNMKVWFFGFGRLPGKITTGWIFPNASKKIAEPNVAVLWSFTKRRKRDLDRHNNFALFDLSRRSHFRSVIPVCFSRAIYDLKTKIDPFAGRRNLKFEILISLRCIRCDKYLANIAAP